MLVEVPLVETAAGAWRRLLGTKRRTVYQQWVAAERGRSPVQLFEAWPADTVRIEVTTNARHGDELLRPVVAYQRHAKQAGTWWLSQRDDAGTLQVTPVGGWSPWFAADGHLVAEGLEEGDAPIAFVVGLVQGTQRRRQDQRFGLVEVRVTVWRS